MKNEIQIEIPLNKTRGPWTQFMDMHSGGSLKLKHQYIYIQAPEAEAEIIFYKKFGRNPNRVTCTCCGEDYSTTESKDLYQATAHERNCHYEENKYIERLREKAYDGQKYIPLHEYLNEKGVLFIFEDEIKPEERVGELPEEGYVWH